MRTNSVICPSHLSTIFTRNSNGAVPNLRNSQNDILASGKMIVESLQSKTLAKTLGPALYF